MSGPRPGPRRRARRRSVRLTLTVLYSALFLAAGTVLLGLVYLLFRQGLSHNVTVLPKSDLPGHSVSGLSARQIKELADHFNQATLHQLIVTSASALAATMAAAVLLGWWTAGRVLRPLHRITATARRLSFENLHERIALDGPADELRELADTFDAMLDRLDSAFDSQRRFVANASHELRTPLAVQRAAIQIRLARATPAEIPRVQAELLAANRRSEQLIEGLLQLARSDRGLTRREPVELVEVLREETEACRAVAQSVGLSLRRVDPEAPETPATVLGDRVLLAQLVVNLLHNAIRYNVRGGAVAVGVTVDGAQARLSVANTGPVVPVDQVEQLFEPFRRLGRRGEPAGPTAELGFSAGLGLSIVRSVATAHGGTVTATANPAGGLTVEAVLPLAEPSARRDPGSRRTAEPRPARAAS
ncbi:sensor histidine kinase [Streptacidiphilus jiangxiensis]|uniref:histidine kinase n=1 Tax=Streptacidiphilus jiangxiensis TaxID=235985 RepID=A0A1H7L189_STRJI|nr:HAMP domain-containing sensor histidine kinase [Streptacidiphilus jiangxiensis]SEK92560.1 Signal transduction histidine kinase [Streptacidiphilus jiangxiensis]